jgi:hypothetical protein
MGAQWSTGRQCGLSSHPEAPRKRCRAAARRRHRDLGNGKGIIDIGGPEDDQVRRASYRSRLHRQGFGSPLRAKRRRASTRSRTRCSDARPSKTSGSVRHGRPRGQVLALKQNRCDDRGQEALRRHEATRGAFTISTGERPRPHSRRRSSSIAPSPSAATSFRPASLKSV